MASKVTSTLAGDALKDALSTSMQKDFDPRQDLQELHLIPHRLRSKLKAAKPMLPHSSHQTIPSFRTDWLGMSLVS